MNDIKSFYEKFDLFMTNKNINFPKFNTYK